LFSEARRGAFLFFGAAKKRRKTMVRAVLMLTAWTLVLFAGVARAEELKVADVLKETQINGLLSAGYNYNWNEPHDRGIDLRPFNDKHDSFTLELAQLVFHKDATEPEQAGFRLDLNFGYTVPKAIHSTGASSSDDLDVRQAFISYIAPVGSGLKIDFGKFVTDHGMEVIEGYEDWNWNYSRSLLFYFAIPFTHTGVRGTYAVNDKLTLSGAIVNGWDNVTDNNTSKSGHIFAYITPVEGTTIGVKYMVGAEQTDNNGNLRHLVNVNLSTAIDKLLLRADLAYGKEEDVPGIGDSTWKALAGYLRFPITEKFAINARAEVFYDDDGARTGTEQDLWEVTLTPEYTLNENLLIRGEYRHDESDQEAFGEGGGTSESQDTIGINAIYHF